MQTCVLRGYEDAAAELIERYEAVSSADLLAAVHDHLPGQPCSVLDIGAGTGRDAAWFASQSHSVVAVEPVAALRHAGMARHRSPNIRWLDDTLPKLARTTELGEQFDFILLSAVWQHLDNDDRQAAFAALRMLIAEQGKIVMSLRQGPGVPSRPVYPVNVAETRSLAENNGFSVLSEATMPSVQKQNEAMQVTWTWLVLQAGHGGNRDGRQGQ